MGGAIVKTGANVQKKANTIRVNATNGDIDFSSAKSIAQSSDKDITHGSYKQPKAPATTELLVTKVEGPKLVEIGKTYTFKATTFTRKAIGGELKAVKWAYKIDGGPMQYFKKPGLVVGNIVTKNITIEADLYDNKKLLVYAYLQAPSVNAESKIDTVTLPIIIDRYKVKGQKSAGVIADDMCYGDGVNLKTGHSIYSIQSIKDLGWLMSNDIDRPESHHWSALTTMVTDLFSVGELEKVAVKMIARFKANTGGEFTDAVLTKHVKEHESTKRFSTSLEKLITDSIKNGKGNLKPLKNETVYWTGKPYGRPQFSSKKDTFFGGLTICINDTWAYEVSITEYTLSGTSFSGKYKVTLYDHFGLDQPDVEKKYSWLAGFRSWYILQHRRNYKPFITKVEFENTFNGTL